MIQFGVLGPLSVYRNGVAVEIEAPMLRRLLAVLLCRTPHPVSATEALHALWGDAPPPSARKTLQVYVHRLRRVVGEERIGHGPAGYVVHAEARELDALRFAELLDRGRAAYRQPRLDVAAGLLGEALGLWRGAAYAEFATTALVAEEAARLDEQHLLAVEELVTVELERGRYAEVVPRLSDLTVQYPYRENLCGQLMTALYHAGRQAEALEAYRRTRALLAEDLAVEPVPELQRLHESILRGDLPRPVHPSATASPVPRELPHDVSAFTGRADALRFLDSALGSADRGPIVISTISGMGGVGKTALAVHWGHRMASRFTDGQLYVDLRGYAPGPPLPPIDALGLFLRTLGVAADEVPVDLDRAARMYRTLVADRRMLVVLDNARDARQVRPLLPAGPDCLVLVTSRDLLTGLVARDGARRLMLDALPPAESAALLARVLGGAGVRVEPADVAELAAACGHLPLALRIAAANLAEQSDSGRSGPDVAGYLDALRTDRALAGLAVDGDPEASIRATFDLSYRTLAPAARALFRHLGLVPGPDITAEAAAALAGGTAEVCRRWLDTLAGAHLMTRHRPDRYAMHDLLRHYARELGRTRDTGADRAAAYTRLCDFYLSTVDAAARLLYPAGVRIPLEPPVPEVAFPDEASALAWLDAELPNLVASTAYAAEHGPRRAAWLMADVLRGYFWIRRHTGDWLATARAGLAAAGESGDRHGRAASHLSLALAHRTLADFTATIEHATAALAIARDLDWPDVQASALSNLAVAYAETGRTRVALARLTEGHTVAERMGKPVARAVLLGNMCTLRHNMGDLHGSLRDALAALAIYADARSPGTEALAHCGAGCSYVYLGQFDRAIDHLTRAGDLFERIGERYGQAITSGLFAKLHCERGDYEGALRHSTAGLAYSREAGDRLAEAMMLTDLATIRAHLGEHRQALRDASEARDLARGAGSCHAEVEALIAIAEAHRHAGELEGALGAARQAADLADEREYRLLQAEALTSATATMMATGDHDGAVKTGEAAIALHRTTGYLAGAARTEALLKPRALRPGT